MEEQIKQLIEKWEVFTEQYEYYPITDWNCGYNDGREKTLEDCISDLKALLKKDN